MANHPSSAKRARQTEARTARNTARLGRVRSAIRSFRRALEQGEPGQLDTLLQAATKELQRAATKGVLHARNAARRISRLTQARNKTVAEKA